MRKDLEQNKNLKTRGKAKAIKFNGGKVSRLETSIKEWRWDGSKLEEVKKRITD